MLAVAAISYRRRPDVRKRLMLFANISLMTAPITHLLGHIPSTWLSPAASFAAFEILCILFLLAPVANDYLIEKRIRFLTAATAIWFLANQMLVSRSMHRFGGLNGGCDAA